MKRIVAMIIVIATLIAGATFAESYPAKVMINGRMYGGLDEGPYVKDGYTMVSSAALAYELDQQIDVQPGDRQIKMASGQTIDLTVPAKAVGTRVYVPVRDVCEALGYNVRWIDAQRTAYVSTRDNQSHNEYYIELPAYGLCGWGWDDDYSQVSIVSMIYYPDLQLSFNGVLLKPIKQYKYMQSNYYDFAVSTDLTLKETTPIGVSIGDGNIYIVDLVTN